MYFAYFTSIETLNCLIQIYVASCTSIIGYIIMHNVNSVRNFEHYIKREYYSMSFCCILWYKECNHFSLWLKGTCVLLLPQTLLEIMRCCYLPRGTLHIGYSFWASMQRNSKYIFYENSKIKSPVYECIIIKKIFFLDY